MAGPRERRHTAHTLVAAALACATVALLAAAPAGFAWPGAAAVDLQDLTAIDHNRRQLAAERLSADGAPEARAGLLSLLDDPAPAVRLTAARALAQQGAPEAIEAATRWTISATPANRRLGLDVLREAPAALPAAALRAVERSLSDADLTVRLLAIDTLTQQKDLAPSLLPLATASEDDNREVRVRAIRALAASRDRRAVVPLLARLGDIDRQVRVEAINGLALIGDLHTAPALKRQLGDPADDVRIAAALALGKLKIADAVPAIADLMRRPPFEDVGRQAALALGDIATPVAIAYLVERLRDPPVADEVLAGLLHAGAAEIPPTGMLGLGLLVLLNEAQQGTATSGAAAVTLVGQLFAAPTGGDRAGASAVKGVLVEIVGRRGSSPGPTVTAAIGALAAIKDPETLPVLLDAATDPLAETRRDAYRALLAIGDDRALAILERGLADRDAQVRALALRLGGRLGPPGPSAMAAMAARLGDNDLGVALEAAAALARLRWRIPGTVPPLLALLARTPDDGAAGGGGTGGPGDARARGIGEAHGDAPGSAAADPPAGALADALAVSASPADDATLAAALRRSPARGRRWIARALAAAHAAQPLEDGPLVDLLIGALAQGAPEAEAAADALASARGLRGREAAILRAFDAAEPDVQPRLCGAIAALAGAAGRDRLMALVADAGERTAVRAAAAWALPRARELRRDDLAGAAALRFTLTRAGTASEPALAANARGALAALAAGAASVGATGGKTEAHAAWAAVRLVGADGAPLAHEWLTLTAADGTTVWTQSGLDGVARLQGLPPGPYQVRLMNPTLAPRTSSPAP